MKKPKQSDRSDIQIYSPYANVPVNGNIDLFNGPLAITGESQAVTGPGRVSVRLSDDPCIQLDMSFSSTDIYGFDGEMSIPSLPQCAAATFQLLTRHITFPPGEGILSGQLVGDGFTFRKLTADKQQESVGRIEFHLINFPQYLGKRLWMRYGETSTSWPGRISVQFGGWTLTIDQFSDVGIRLDNAKATRGYALTHVCSLRRTDDKLFDPDRATRELEMIYWFTSFIAGRHIAQVLPTGLRYLGVPIWQRWCMHSSSLIIKTQNWFTKYATSACFSSISGFHALWGSSDKRKWLRSAIGLYLACNISRGAIELSLAESQILLEMLSWVALLEENSLMSEQGFEGLAAADRLRVLLFWIGVSPSIPSSRTRLASEYSSDDAPQAVVNIRNAIIHPTRANRIRRDKISDEAIYEAWQLNLWYAELALLKLFGYAGPYCNRNGNPEKRVFDFVPWATPLNP